MSRFLDRGWAERTEAARARPKLTLRRTVIWQGFYHDRRLGRYRSQLFRDVEDTGATRLDYDGAVVGKAPLGPVGGVYEVGDAKTGLGMSVYEGSCVTHQVNITHSILVAEGIMGDAGPKQETINAVQQDHFLRRYAMRSKDIACEPFDFMAAVGRPFGATARDRCRFKEIKGRQARGQ